MLKSLQNLKPGVRIAIAGLCVLVGCALIVLGQIKTYSLVIDGNEIRLKALVFRASQLFEMAEIEIQEADQLSLDPEAIDFALPQKIYLTSARNVLVKTSSDDVISFSAELLPANLLAQSGVLLYPKDKILLGGHEIPFDQALPAGEDVVIEYLPAKRVEIMADGKYSATLFTQADTFAAALAEAGITLHPMDQVDPAPESQLQAVNRFNLVSARQVCAAAGKRTVCGLTPAKTVAGALADLRLTPQNFDSVEPVEGDPVNLSQTIRLRAVREFIRLVKDESAYGYSYQMDPNAELDTTSVIAAGRPGIVVSRATERFVDGELVSTITEEEWQASEESDAILGYGTLATLKTETVEGNQLEYWRKVSVYATSYHPAEFGGSARTRSGLPLTKGIIAVSSAWYPSMALQRVYVPGYGFGTIADSGGGIPGRYWIDLGYDDENYVGWHDWTTLYFLAPIPANYLGVLP